MNLPKHESISNSKPDAPPLRGKYRWGTVITQILPLVIALAIVLWVFQNWFFSPVNLGGDFNFVAYDHFKTFSRQPFIWDPTINNGFGQITLFTLPFFYYSYLSNLLTFTIQNPFLLHRLIFLWPLLALAVLSIYVLVRLLIKNKWAQATTIVLYLTNSYFLMLASGGQIGVAFAYAFAPLVLASFIKTLRHINEDNKWPTKIRYYLLDALLFAILVACDTRIALLVTAALALLFTANFITRAHKHLLLTQYLTLILITISSTFLFHAYWILPSLFVQAVALPQGYDAPASVQFFSFGRFAHTLTWTHPNYPQNVFGVVKEVTGIAFIFPLLAFLSIQTKRRLILYFSFLALIGAFLAKGTNPPFGEFYSWLFQHLPLFSWYRDSTKFYLYISLGYAILIGITIEQLLAGNFKKMLPKPITLALITIAIAYAWLPTYAHQLKGTLAYKTYPPEFQKLETLLKNDKTFGRVLWIPQREEYGYTDLNHPAVSLTELRNPPTCQEILCITPKAPMPSTKQFNREDLLKEIDNTMALFSDPYTQEIFQSLAINYIVISPDINHSIYIFDKKYDPAIRDYYAQKIIHLGWMQSVPQVSIAYQTTKRGALLATTDNLSLTPVSYTMQNPTKYTLNIPQTTSPLTFTQSFNPHWHIQQDNNEIYSYPSKANMNEFPTDKLHPGKATLTLVGQSYASLGWTISIAAITFLIGLIVIIYTKQSSL